MIKNMLQAASKMLDKNADPKVQCAKVVIDEIVDSLSENDLSVEDLLPVSVENKNKAKSDVSKTNKENKYKVTVDRNRNLEEIEGLPLDADLEIDGKIVKHKDAIGKPFNSGKIL